MQLGATWCNLMQLGGNVWEIAAYIAPKSLLVYVLAKTLHWKTRQKPHQKSHGETGLFLNNIEAALSE